VPVRVRIAVPVDFALRSPIMSPRDAFGMAIGVGLLAALFQHDK
jgi:hypothetical protein